MSKDTVLLERRDAVARVTLNRPDVLNSFNGPMFSRMRAVLTEIAADRSVRAVYLTGAGRGFCAGQDIGGGVPDGPYGAHLAESWNPIATAIRELDRPVVAGVNGVAAGAGANLALAADFVVAAEEASFIQAFVNIGLVPDTGGTLTVPQLVGRARATAMLMLGDKVPASQALAWGLIHQTCPAAELDEGAAGARTLGLPAVPAIRRSGLGRGYCDVVEPQHHGLRKGWWSLRVRSTRAPNTKNQNGTQRRK
jgi:2-(1,2-epoxy-1,2-dihydrophenyl)acetyl-CoA isomerase